MRILLLKPSPVAVRFGLAPFFQTEPLGLQYVASALKAAGHTVQVADLRFERRSLDSILRQFRPDVAGISCLHVLDTTATLALAARLKAFDRRLFVAVGGHSISAYPEAIAGNLDIDAVCVGEGESVMPALAAAIAAGRGIEEIPRLLLPNGGGSFRSTGEGAGWLELSGVGPPDRSVVARYQHRYCCLNYIPVWTIETTRGCPYRCSFCSVWQFYKRSCRFHAPGTVRRDFEAAGPNVFVIDDLFWADEEPSRELAGALSASPERKNWILAQTRLDLVNSRPELLERWRPLASKFDIFFGFESPSRAGLDSLNKDFDVSATVSAIRTARRLGFGVTGNFIIHPDFTEEDFHELWAFLDEHKLARVGFTILTPLPGTYFFEQMKSRLQVLDWSQYDLHHLLWSPRLPVERFFELYCETWRRTVLNAAGSKKWWRWLGEVRPNRVVRMLRILARTQTLMNPNAYLSETKVGNRPAGET